MSATVKKSENIYSKLLEFQTKIHAIKKDKQNPHFKSHYATLPQILSEVKPLLSEAGLILLQPIFDGKVGTTIICSETGEKIESDMILPVNMTPQQIGSAITYFRRYLLAGMLSLEIEDDDANATKPKISAEDVLQKAATVEGLTTIYMALPESEKTRLKGFASQLKEKLNLKVA